MSRILITGTRAPIARDLAQAFAAGGHDVHLADVFRNRTAGRFPWHLYASPVDDPHGFHSDTVRITEGLQPDLIIPLCEEVFHWAAVAERYALPLFAPPLTALMRLHSKRAFNQWARDLGLDAPATETIPDIRNFQPAGDCVVKPDYSRFGAFCLVRPMSAQLQGLEDNAANPWLAQTYIDGEDLCLHAIARNGQITAFAAYRSRWRTGGGASYHFEPLDPALSDRLFAIGQQLVAAGNLTGQIACDLRRDRDGRLWLIECNPRGTSGLHLLAHDPEGLSRAFLGGGPCLQASQDPACISLAMWLFGLPKAIAMGRIGRWRTDARARDVLAGANRGALVDTVAHSVKAALRGQSLATFLTADIECNGWSRLQ